MRQFVFTVFSAAAISACSEGRERRVLSIDSTVDRPDLTLPDTSTQRDTSGSVATRTEPPVSQVEQQPAKPEPSPARRARLARRRPAPVPKAAAADKPDTSDTSVQGYAPNRAVSTDSAVTRSDTRTTLPDSAAYARGTEPATDASGMETTTAAAPADSASTPSPDTMVDSQPAEPPAPPDRSAAELAARTLAVGTEIHAQLDDSITSRRDTVGHIVSAHVMENVLGPNGRTLIPAGAQVRFTITRLRPSRSKSSQGRLGLRVDSIALNGELATVKAETRAVPRELRGRGVTGGDAAKVGGGAAAGAVIGGVVSGNTRGAVIGGVAGAAAGAVVATQTATRDVIVKAKTPVVFVLTAPLVAP